MTNFLTGLRLQKQSSRDERGPEGDLIGGWRLVRPGGRIKIEHRWYAAPELEAYVHHKVWVNCWDAQDSVSPKIIVYRFRYNESSYIVHASRSDYEF